MKTTMRPLFLSGLIILGSGMTTQAQPVSIFPGDDPAMSSAASSLDLGSPYWYWTGSMPEGDYVPGMGAYGIGAVIDDYETARAEAIHAQMTFAVLLMERESIRQQGLRLRRSALAERARIAAYHTKKEDRLRNRPEWRDVMLGDSLNLALADLKRLGDYWLAAEASAVPVPASLVNKIPFRYWPTEKAVSLEKLSAEPMSSHFRRIVIGRNEVRFQDFVRKVARSEEISIGELITFMHDLGLRFDVARRPADREAYLMLHDRFSILRKEVLDRSARAGELAER